MKIQLIGMFVFLVSVCSFGQDVQKLKADLTKVKNDTTRANILSQLVLLITDDSKWTFNDSLKRFVDKKMMTTAKNSPDFKTFKKYKAFAINQEGLKRMNFEGDFKGAILEFEAAVKFVKN